MFVAKTATSRRYSDRRRNKPENVDCDDFPRGKECAHILQVKLGEMVGRYTSHDVPGQAVTRSKHAVDDVMDQCTGYCNNSFIEPWFWLVLA